MLTQCSKTTSCKKDCNENGDEPKKLFIQNPHLKDLKKDILYHLGLDTTHNLKELFGDVKFVCMGGTPERMRGFAKLVMEEIGYKLPYGSSLQDLAGLRYSLFKIGPVISVSHGMGPSSISILLQEMIKLMYYAECDDPIFVRIGSSGGIGIKGGIVAITQEPLDGMLRNKYCLPVLGKMLEKDAILDQTLAQELKDLADKLNIPAALGKTICTDGFYEGQGRLDGAFCNYTPEDRIAFLKKIKDIGVINMEMEAVPFAALTFQAGIRAADVCVTIVDRLEKGDQIETPPEKLREWELYPQMLITKYIKNYLSQHNLI